ncbi:MAG TPA: deaminase domain-containing protein [Kiritimatiellia bacterium]|nr:deaminase domain-containing protein [Kiritimatiellia bacterium]
MNARGLGKRLGIVLAAATLAWGAAATAQDKLPPEQILPTVRQPTLRKIHREKDALALERIELYRAKLPEQFRKRNNFAWACAKIKDLDKVEYYAHSGIQSLDDFSEETAKELAGISVRPEKGRYKALCVNQNDVVDGNDCWVRVVDTEYKIIEDMAARMPDPSVKGRIKLYTDLPPCASCWNAMKQFMAEYTNVNMSVLYRSK